MTIMRKVLASKIHRATVTESNIDYEGSITIGPQLRKAADFMPYDAVQVWNVSSGARFETYVIAGELDNGSICVNGAAAHLAKPGDLVIVARYVWLDEAEYKNFQPKIVMVDANNKPTTYL
jgi:aspartate 1-decarboxylase